MKMKKIAAMMTMAVMGVSLLASCTQSQNQQNAGQGSEGKAYKVAVVQHMEHPSLNEIRDTIISQLEASGKDIEIIEKNGNGDTSLLPSIMQELVSSGVDMIIPIATPTAQAAASATTSIPIVFSAVSTPVEAGLVKDINETTGNVTGVSDKIAVEDIFDMAKQLTPEMMTVGFVYNKGEVNSASGVERAKAYCEENGLQYKEALANNTSEVQQAASSIANDVDVFFTPDDNTVASAMSIYLKVANDVNKPIYVGADSMVKDGGFATVGINYVTLGKQTADMALKILDGAKISDTPIENIKETSKMINKQTADALGIVIPEEYQDCFIDE